MTSGCLCPQREKLILQLEEERRLRLESEKRLREVTEEAELGRAQMVSLQQQFSRYHPQHPHHTCVCVCQVTSSTPQG